jgi:hypothetical protein
MAKSVFQVELASYFALTTEQVEEMTSNWAIEYTLEQTLVLDSILPIAGTTNKNVEGAGYWQWANAYMT